jgi:hypothetical protein
MNEYGIRASPDAVMYFDRIADAMTALFAISRPQAVERIGKFWRGLSFITDLQVGLLEHREPDLWARHIYHGGRNRGQRASLEIPPGPVNR